MVFGEILITDTCAMRTELLLICNENLASKLTRGSAVIFAVVK